MFVINIRIPQPSPDDHMVILYWESQFFRKESLVRSLVYSTSSDLITMSQSQRSQTFSTMIRKVLQSGWRFVSKDHEPLSHFQVKAFFGEMFIYKQCNGRCKLIDQSLRILPSYLNDVPKDCSQSERVKAVMKNDCRDLEVILRNQAPEELRNKFFGAHYMCTTHNVAPENYLFVDNVGSCTLVPTSRIPLQNRSIYPHLAGLTDDQVNDSFWMMDCASWGFSGVRCVLFSCTHKRRGVNWHHYLEPYQSTYVVECEPEDGATITSTYEIFCNDSLAGFVKTKSLVKAYRVWEFRTGQYGRYVDTGAFVRLIRDNGDISTPIEDLKYIVP
jgi:hypothetical protein